MPIYEYGCEDCGEVTEALRKIAEADAPLTCEKCTSQKTRRVHSVFAPGSSESKMPDLPMGGCGRCGDPNGPCAMG